MSYDEDWPDDTTETRREAIRKTIKPSTLAELKEVGAKRFPIVTDPWCERYFQFLKNHPDDKFYQATSPEGAEILYCRDAEQGIWFLKDNGMGILQPGGLKILREVVDSL